MTPVHDLNHPPKTSSFPVMELKNDPQVLQLLLQAPHQYAPSISAPPPFINPAQEHKLCHYSDHHEVYLGSSPCKTVINETTSHVHKLLTTCKREDGDDGHEGTSTTDTSLNWMPSKKGTDHRQLMQKLKNSDCSEADHKPVRFMIKFREHQRNRVNESSNNSAIRVCSDCNTTTTPLWRSGPLGPKSLCNACGIRQRKARRAMAAAAAAASTGTTTIETSLLTKNKIIKEKKSRTIHNVVQCKKPMISEPPDLVRPRPPPPPTETQNKKLCFKNLALSLSSNSALQRVFPQDVEEAAVLLMELSCGFINH